MSDVYIWKDRDGNLGADAHHGNALHEATTDARGLNRVIGSGSVWHVDTDDLCKTGDDKTDDFNRHTRLARKHTAAVAELAEVDPQQAYEFFEAMHVECAGHADKLANAMLEDGSPRKRPEPVDEIAKLRALVDALMPVVAAAYDWAATRESGNWDVATGSLAIDLHDRVLAARPRVAAALAGVSIADERVEAVRSAYALHKQYGDKTGWHDLMVALEALCSSAPPQDKGRLPASKYHHPECNDSSCSGDC